MERPTLRDRHCATDEEARQPSKRTGTTQHSRATTLIEIAIASTILWRRRPATNRPSA